MHQTEPNIKRKNQSPLRIIVNRWGCLLGFVMLGLGAGMGLLGAIFVGPQLLGFDVTATALMDREIMLAATAVDLHTRAQDAESEATGFALDVQSTQAVLNNNADLIGQTATQSALNIVATITAGAVQNVQRQTEVANDFASTQAALNADATRFAIEFRNTQSALGVGSAQSENNIAGTPLARYTFDFAELDFNDNSGLWQFSSRVAWEASNEGLVAQSDNARLMEQTPYILTNHGFANTYSINATISPATVLNADYWLIFALTEETGLAAHFHAEALTVSQVALYSFDRTQLDATLMTDNLTVIRRNASDVILTGQTQLMVHVDADAVSLLINDESVLQAQDVPIELGAIGVQFPAETTLISISVSD